jgi:hypothetical protein
MNSVRRNANKYMRMGINMVFISPEDEQAVHTFKISQAIPLPFGLHAGRKAIEFFVESEHIGELPAAYLLDRGLHVVWSHIGMNAGDRPSDPELVAAIQANL